MKTVLIVGYMHSKYDKRVFRTVQALSKYTKVVYQYITEDYEKPSEIDNVFYYPIRWKEQTGISQVKKFFQRRKLDDQIIKLIFSTNFDILYLHHFLPSKPLLPFKWAKSRGKKVVFDVHEYHPQNFLSNLGGFFGKVKEQLMVNIFKEQMQLADKLIFVSKEIPEDLGITKDFLVIPNYAERIDLQIDLKAKIESKEIVFVGKVARKLQEEKSILTKLKDNGFSFHVIGMDDKLFEDLPHKATKFLPYKEMIKELSRATFSLVSYSTIGTNDYRNDLYSLPHKFYDSLAARTPVVVRYDFVSMRKIVERCKVGVIIKPSDVQDSVHRILEAYANYHALIENIEEHIDEFTWNERKEKEFTDYILK
ncbi:MAG: glycosyl transferase family 1 [Fervidobacterium sp.]|nr:glycosyl transferase family 1 [Fervidobacterium sp.]